MILQIGKKTTAFYSYKTYLTDSLSNDVDIHIILSDRKKYGRKGLLYDIFQNYPLGKITYAENFGRKNFRYAQPLKLQEWKILSDTNSLLGYKVQKAECNYGGRKWIAWFAPEIPISFGPWKLNGLPGLILSANDEKNYFHFTITGFEYLKNKTPIQLPHFGKRTYTDVTKDELLKMEYKMYTNPIGFLNENMGMSMHSVGNKNPSPNQIKIYTPIELY